VKRRDLIRVAPALLTAPAIFAAAPARGASDARYNPIEEGLPTTSDIEAEIARVPLGGVVDLRGGTYHLDRTLLLRTGRTLANATLFASTDDGNAIEIRDQYTGTRGGNIRNVLDNVRLDGRGMGRGLLISARSVGLESVNITDFARGVQAGSNSYIWAWDKVWIHDCKHAVWFLGHNLTNSGENIAMYSCTFAACSGSAVVLTGCGVRMFACSVDYNEGYGMDIGQDGRVAAFGCHFENYKGKQHVHTRANGKFESENSTYVWTKRPTASR
jgi:hypothetical protein